MDSSSSGKENHERLGSLVINLGTSALQDIFRKRYKTLTNCEWESSSANDFFTSVITSDERKSTYNIMRLDQKANLLYVKNWDVTMLHSVLKNIDYTRNSPSVQATSDQDTENGHIQKLKDVRNKYSHLSEQIIPQKEFDDWWAQAESALLSLGVSQSEIKIARELGIIKSFQQFDSPCPNFTGRKELLEKLHNCLSECSTKNDFKDRIVVLCGIGGVGKTELARKYAATHLKNPIIQNVAWIDAETLSNLTDSFVSLSKKLGLLKTDEMKIDEIVEDVYQHFSKYIGTGLFIFDNSQEMNNKQFTVYKYLPSQFLQRRPLVLITARDKTWEIPNQNILSVDTLSTCESMELLIKKIQLNPAQETFPREKAALKKLADAFQGYPLGISLATFNMDINEWTDLVDEIENYLKRMRKPKGGWLKDRQFGAATSYPHIIEDVWELTFNKIKNSERNGRMSIELLNCMAFLPTDLITIELLQNVYEFILKKGFTRSGLSILDKYSLVRSHIEAFGGVTNQRIGIHRLVQRCVREKLDHEQNSMYLSGICEYFSNLALKPRQDNLSKDALIVSHEFLKERSWPLEGISFSAIFCSIFARCSNYDDAFSIALDVHQFLETNKNTKNFKKPDFRNLFMMSVFWINFNDRFCREKIYEDPKLKRENLESTFISLIQPSIEYVQISKSCVGSESTVSVRTSDLVKHHCFKLCFTILENFPYYSKGLQSQASDTILATVNSMSGFNFQNIKEIFDLLWECCKCVSMQNSLYYIETLYKKHFEVYSNLKIAGFSDLESQLSNYWNEDGAMDFYRYIVVIHRHDDGLSGFVDSFFAAGGLQFLTHYIEFRRWNKIDSVELPVFDFIHTISYDMNLSHKLIQSSEFMRVYHEFTKELVNLKTNSLHLKLWCIFTWFPLFARNKALFDDRGHEWSIASVTSEMEVILLEIKGRYWGKVPKFTYKTTQKCMEILESFLEPETAEEPNSIAVSTALHLIQFLGDSEVSHKYDEIIVPQMASFNKTTFYKIDLPTRNFTGRKELLQRMHNRLRACSNKKQFHERMVVLHAPRGMGKSEAARMYAHTYNQDPNIQNVFWFNAENTTTLKQHFFSLAEELEIKDRDQNLDTLVEDIYQHFSDSIPTGLFIFDNLDPEDINKPFEEIFDFLPSKNLKHCPLIIITSRNSSNWKIPKQNIIEIEPLTNRESIEILENNHHLTAGEKRIEAYQIAIRKLAGSLHGSPMLCTLIVFNKNVRKWNHLKNDFDSYQDQIDELNKTLVDKNEIVISAKLVLLFEKVLETALGNFKRMQAQESHAVDILNVMAYLPNNFDFNSTKGMERRLQFICNTSSLQKDFLLLEMYSLITTHTKKHRSYKEDVHFIEVPVHIRAWIRNNLHQKNDFRYLFGICKYTLCRSLEIDYSRLTRKSKIEKILCLHKYLKVENWPQNSIYYSVMFCSLWCKYSEYHIAQSLAQDAWEFFQSKQNCSLDEEQDKKMKDILNLLLLCLFRINYVVHLRGYRTSSVIGHNTLDDWDSSSYYEMHMVASLSKDKLMNTFTSTVKSALEESILHPAADLSQVEEYTNDMCLGILSKLYPCKYGRYETWSIEKEATKEAAGIILTTISRSQNYCPDNIGRAYNLLWTCLWVVKPLKYVEYIDVAFSKHFEIYPRLVQWSQRMADKNLKKYWQKGGPLDFLTITRICKYKKENWNMLLESFFAQNGLTILVDYVNFLRQNYFCEGYAASQFLSFIRYVTYKEAFANRLTQSTEFMDSYSKFTIILSIHSQEEYLEDQFGCLVSWFGMYGRRNVCRGRGSEADSGIHEVAPALNAMLCRIKQKGWIYDYYSEQFDKDAVSSFLDTNRNHSEFLAVQIATDFFDFIQQHFGKYELYEYRDKSWFRWIHKKKSESTD